MAILKRETLPIRSDQDIVRVRQAVRAWTVELKFSLVDQTKFITAASELARNTYQYGGEGEVHMESLQERGKVGIRLTFVDHGPGIPDIDQALTDGYTTGGGMGLGLSGAKRLSNEFAIESKVGEGTTVVITRWK